MKIIYAIVAYTGQEASKPFGQVGGIGGSTLHLVCFKDIAAIVGEADWVNKQNDIPMALGYAKAVDDLAQKFTLLPMRFGTLVESEKSIQLLLSGYYDQFSDNLHRVEHKQEFGLKIWWNEPYDSEFIKNLPEDAFPGYSFTNRSMHKDYLLEKIKKQRWEHRAMLYAGELEEEICCHLAPCKPVNNIKKMTAKNVLMDAAFLVDKSYTEYFTQAMEIWMDKHRRLQFLFTGPWPPYNFVSGTSLM